MMKGVLLTSVCVVVVLGMAPMATGAEFYVAEGSLTVGGGFAFASGQLGTVDTSTEPPSTTFIRLYPADVRFEGAGGIAYHGGLIHLVSRKFGANPTHSFYRTIDPSNDFAKSPLVELADPFMKGATWDEDLDVLWTSGVDVVSWRDTDADGMVDTEVTRHTFDTLGLATSIHGLAYNTSNNTLYGITEPGELYSINKTTGTTTIVVNIEPTINNFTESLAYDAKEDLLFTGGQLEDMWSITTGGTLTYLGLVADPMDRADGLAPIPEPGTLFLVGLGGALMMVRRAS